MTYEEFEKVAAARGKVHASSRKSRKFVTGRALYVERQFDKSYYVELEESPGSLFYIGCDSDNRSYLSSVKRYKINNRWYAICIPLVRHRSGTPRCGRFHGVVASEHRRISCQDRHPRFAGSATTPLDMRGLPADLVRPETLLDHSKPRGPSLVCHTAASSNLARLH